MLMAFSCFVSCDKEEGETESTTEALATSDAETTTALVPGTEVVENKELRVIISSDVHHCTTNWYNLSSSIRMQMWVNAIKEEHEKKPIDLLIINGDTSLDYYAKQGTYTEQGISYTKEFVERFVSQLPEEIPVYIMPGNHEAYTNAKWKEITGNDRQQTVAMKGNLFILLDNYGSEVGLKYDGDAACTPTDVGYIEQQMEAHPECNKVWLIAHHFDVKNESEEFKALVKNNKKILGLFSGHSHQNSVTNLGAEFGGKKLAQTGNFSYSYYTAMPSGDEAKDLSNLKNSFWGFRELNIMSEAGISNYIICKTSGASYNGQVIKLERRTVDSVRYY